MKHDPFHQGGRIVRGNRHRFSVLVGQLDLLRGKRPRRREKHENIREKKQKQCLMSQHSVKYTQGIHSSRVHTILGAGTYGTRDVCCLSQDAFFPGRFGTVPYGRATTFVLRFIIRDVDFMVARTVSTSTVIRRYGATFLPSNPRHHLT